MTSDSGKEGIKMEDNNLLLKSTNISNMESKFIDEFMQHGNQTLVVINAGYKTKAPSR